MWRGEGAAIYYRNYPSNPTSPPTQPLPHKKWTVPYYDATGNIWELIYRCLWHWLLLLHSLVPAALKVEEKWYGTIRRALLIKNTYSSTHWSNEGNSYKYFQLKWGNVKSHALVSEHGTHVSWWVIMWTHPFSSTHASFWALKWASVYDVILGTQCLNTAPFCAGVQALMVGQQV